MDIFLVYLRHSHGWPMIKIMKFRGLEILQLHNVWLVLSTWPLLWNLRDLKHPFQVSILIDRLLLCSFLAYFIRHRLSSYLIYFIHVCHPVALPVALGSIACFVILCLMLCENLPSVLMLCENLWQLIWLFSLIVCFCNLHCLVFSPWIEQGRQMAGHLHQVSRSFHSTAVTMPIHLIVTWYLLSQPFQRKQSLPLHTNQLI